MPPKQRITREMILEKSFAMFCQEGMEAVNARSVAKALNCSTQPIFSYFAGMDDLKNALDQKARDTFEASTAGVADGGRDPLEESCMAYVRFAGEQPRLFAHLFLRMAAEQGSPVMSKEKMDFFVQAESEREGISLEDARQLCVSIWVLAHGMATIRASVQTEFAAERAAQIIAGTRENLIKGLKG